MNSKRVPVATYRLQFNHEFTFAAARESLDYLKQLGISDCYASPLFRAGAQSTHGYDICCFGELSPALGGLEGFRSFSGKARNRGLGLLLDMVPNHMGSALTNQWWVDVLKNGPRSDYAKFFDIDWDPPTPGLRNKVLLPVLEDHYWKVLGKLHVTEENGEFVIAYHDQKFPIAPESKASLKHLHQLLQEQHYRLAYWRVAPHEINYRRFFDITELVSLRMEREEVFESTHKLLFDLIGEGLVTGLRIDHPDGLWDPKQYFERLQNRGPIYVLAEKILTGDEPLPGDWPVDGTTGYDFLNRLNGIFVDQRNEAAMTQVYQDVTGCTDDFADIVYASKKKVLAMSFQSEINTLAHHLKAKPQGQDFTLADLRAAIAETAAAFPVYRTYATDRTDPDPKYIAAVKADGPAMQFVGDVLLMKIPDRQFVMKFQQLTGPVMAKGLEDTAFYNYNRLLSLNEVGGSPEKFGTSVEDFHRYNIEKQKHWPHSLLATATHDTKRGEDLRARLNVLSEMPEEWRGVVSKWIQPTRAPTANDQYMLFQTLVGAWDAGLEGFADRICAFMTKAMREAKANTSWTDPNEEYERATLDFVRRLLAPGNPWWKEFEAFQSRVAFFGHYNSLSQVLLKMTSPGVPDFYQGTELWDFNLVDPDNRRPVDYKLRNELLLKLKRNTPEESKLFVIWRTLQFRNENRELFEKGDYVPIGATIANVCAFARKQEDRTVIVIAPRLISNLCGGKLAAPLGAVWKDATLGIEAAGLQNLFTGEIVSSNRLSEILKTFPIALLARC
ncbi:MAG TPA: malto-oligosyltrehalose synthase [Verrucomicrobiae bacterium]|nr:malto-oligosyltrehalose synthase [Verrucomicrobiae bacterium]